MTAWRDVEVAAAEALEGPHRERSRGDPRRHVHGRGGQGARAGHRPRRGRVRRRARRLGGPGRALDPLRADLLRRARHGARAAAAARRRDRRARRPRARRRAGRAGARARRDAVRRPDPRRARRADVVRAQARRLRARGPPQRRPAGARLRPGRDRRDLRRGRNVRLARPRLRDARARRPRAGPRAGLDPGRPARSPRRAGRRDRARGRRPGALRDGDPAPAAHGGAGGRGAVPRRPEGVERDAAQAQPDRVRADHGPGARPARLRPGRAWRTSRSGTSATSPTPAPSG